MLKWEDAHNRPDGFDNKYFANFLKFVLEKNYAFTVYVLLAIEAFPPLEPPMHYIFAARYIKRPQFSENLKIGAITQGGPL